MIRILQIRQLRAAAWKNPVMLIEIAIEFEIRSIAGVGQHHPGIAADRDHFALFEQVMIIQLECMWLFVHAAEVSDSLTVVFTGRFQLRQFVNPAWPESSTEVAIVLFVPIG